MAALQLSLIMGANDRSRPVLEGTVQPDGIELTGTVAHPSEIFWRQLHFQEFDVSEMSLSSLLMAMANGNRDWIGLPIFTSRRFYHTGIWVRADSGIERPQDLKGKRVGVPEYQQTAALWSRGVLKHEFGVEPEDLDWWMERTEERSHGGATGFKPPAGIRFNRIPGDQSIGSLLMDGKLDATLLYLTDNNLVDRSRITLEGNPAFRCCFPTPPPRASATSKRPAFTRSTTAWSSDGPSTKNTPGCRSTCSTPSARRRIGAAARMQELVSTHVELGLLGPEARQALAVDPYPYGVKSNQKVLETVAQYSHEQGLTPRVMPMDEIFAPSTLDL